MAVKKTKMAKKIVESKKAAGYPKGKQGVSKRAKAMAMKHSKKNNNK